MDPAPSSATSCGTRFTRPYVLSISTVIVPSKKVGILEHTAYTSRSQTRLDLLHHGDVDALQLFVFLLQSSTGTRYCSLQKKTCSHQNNAKGQQQGSLYSRIHNVGTMFEAMEKDPQPLSASNTCTATV